MKVNNTRLAPLNQSEMFITRANFLSRVPTFQNEASDVRKIIYEKY